MTRRKTTEEERKLWRTAMRGVTPLRDWQEPEILSAKTVPAIKPRRPMQARPPVKSVPAKAVVLPVSFDAESERRLQAKQLVIGARLDLHGMTEAAAHKAVLAFLTRALAAQHTLVLIITGKGSTGAGILKRNLALWLEAAPPALRASIRALRPAEPKDGGGGAFYVLLRRK